MQMARVRKIVDFLLARGVFVLVPLASCKQTDFVISTDYKKGWGSIFLVMYIFTFFYSYVHRYLY